MAPDDPAATGDRSRMERATGRTGMLTSERPWPAQAPILFPSGELPVAELQREGGVDRVEAGDARRSVGEIDLRARPAGIVDERHAERDRSLLRRHAEDERSGIGLGPAKGGPADAERRDDALHAKVWVAFPVVVQRNANARSSAQISAYFRSIRARQSSSRGLGRWAGDGPRAADERFDGLDGKQTAGEGGPPGIVTPLRSAVPRPRPSAPGRISLPSIRTRSRTGTLPSRYGLRLRRDRSTA